MVTYIPFGKDCVPAFALKNSGLRNISLPFDWMLAEPHLLKKSLDNKCSDWFNQDRLFNQPELSNLIEFSEGNKATAHLSYLLENKNHSFFAHANLKDLEVCEKIKKRIERFYEIIDSSDDIVFVTSSPYKEFKKNGLLNYFNRKSKTDFVFINYTPDTHGVVVENIENYLNVSYGRCDQFDQNVLKEVGFCIKESIEG